MLKVSPFGRVRELGLKSGFAIFGVFGSIGDFVPDAKSARFGLLKIWQILLIGSLKFTLVSLLELLDLHGVQRVLHCGFLGPVENLLAVLRLGALEAFAEAVD